MDSFLADDQKVAAMRALLPATGAGIYLDTAAAGPLPAETDRALREADDWELRVGRGGPDHATDAELRREEARGVVAAVLGVTPDRVITTVGVRAALAGVLGSLRPPRPVLALAGGLERPVDDGARSIAIARGWTITDGEPAPGSVMLVPWVRADGGGTIALPALADRVHAAGGLLVADVTLAAGAMDLALPSAGADAAILATDRWLLGPDGTAAAWLGAKLGADAIDRAMSVVDPLPRRAALGLGRSVGWLLMYVGLPWAVSRTRAMAERLRDQLAAIPGVRLRGPSDGPPLVIALTIDGWTAGAAADELGRRVFAITGRTPDGGALRTSVGAWTTVAELDRFVAAVAEPAANTPDTLPRRQPLVVLGGG